MKSLDLYNKSRMTGDCQVWFCEELQVKLPLPTRHLTLVTRLRNVLRIMIIYKISKVTLEDTIILGRIDAINDSVDTTIGNKHDNHTLHAYKPIDALYKCYIL